jgi:DHA1 family tetracycline resistance protein-like MFS transporter
LTASTEVAAIYGVILAVYALMQFLFAPVLGMLSDRYGRRPVLLVSLAGAAVDYAVMAIAPSLWLVVVGRAIAGITAANLAVATAYLADITPEEERAGRFGYLHAGFGIGFILGPIIGGILGDDWVRAPFIAAAVLNGINFALALFLLPESHRGERPPLSLRGLNPLGPLRWAFAFAALLPLMAIYFMLNLIGQLYGTVWVLYGEDQFQWTATMVGISLAAFGFFHAGAQALLTGPVTKRIGERAALLLGMISETVALTILAFVTETWMVFALLPLFALGGIGVPALQSLLSNEVGPDKQGQLQGVLASLLSLTSVFGPLIFSWVYFYAHTDWPGFIWLIGAGLYCFTAPLLLAVRRRSPALP